MADTDTDTQIPNTADAIADLQRQLAQPAPTIPTGTPDDGTSPSWTGLLGRVLGGAPAGYQLRGGEADAAGNRALLNFGINMLLASGPHTVRPNVLSSLATGLQGAQESVGQDQRSSAALAGAQYQAAREARQDQLARIKAAIPLLQLQANQRAVAGVPYTVGGGGKPGTPPPGTSIATGGSIAPFVASNLPEGITPDEDQIVRTVIGEAANQGTVGQQGVAAVIKNRMEAGKQNAQDVIFAPNQFEPWNNPKTRADLEKIDPNSKQYQDILNNAVRPVMSGSAKDPTGGATHFYSPTAQDKLGREPPSWAAGQTPTVIGQHNFYKLPYGALQGPAAPPSAPGQTAMAPVGTQPPNTPVQNPPAALPAPVQTAGPGAPTAQATPPPAGAIAAPSGQTAIEPETGAPVVMPSAPGSGPPVFRYTPSQIPPGLIPSGTFTPDQQQAVKTIQDAYVHERQAAAASPNPAEALQKAESNLGTNMTKVLGSQTDAAKVATDALLKFHEADFKQQQDTHAKMLGDYIEQQKFARENEAKRQDTATAQQNAIELARINTEFDKDKEGAKIAMRGDEQRMVKIGEAAAAAGPISSQVQQLTSVMKNLPPDGLVSSVLGSYPALTAAMKAGGVITPETADNVSAFLGLTNHLASQLRGIGSGSMSDKDLASFKTTLPQLMQTPEGRFKAAAFLQNAYDRIMREQEYTQEYFSRVDPKTGKPAHNLIGMNAMINKPADIDASGVNHGGLGPVVPEAPHYGGRSYSDMQTWIRNNVAVGHPYMGWARQYDKNGKEVEPELQLFVRDK